MIVKIAWRNVWRHPVRSLVIMVAVVVGLWAGIFLMSFYYGVGEQRVRIAIESEISHIQIHHPQFKSDYDLRYCIPDDSLIKASIEEDNRIKSIATRTLIQAMASTAAGSRGVMAVGVYPENESATTGLNHKLKSGTYLQTAGKPQVFLGERLLNKLKLRIGNKLILTFNDRNGSITSGAFKVCGTFETGNGPYDERYVFVRKDYLDGLADTKSTSNEIAVLLTSDTSTANFAIDLKRKHPTLLIETWKELSPEINYIASVIDRMLYIFMGIIFLGIGFGIVNTMLMSMLERNRELGMLMALGMNKRNVFLMIVIETIFLVMAGVPIGMTLATVTVNYFNRYGISMDVFAETFSSFGYAQTVYPMLEQRHYYTVLAMVVITALLASLLPARKALQIKAGQAIKK